MFAQRSASSMGTPEGDSFSPEDLTPGHYRICTANAVENLCVPIEIIVP